MWLAAYMVAFLSMLVAVWSHEVALALMFFATEYGAFVMVARQLKAKAEAKEEGGE
jgi:hypothetical protein